MHAYYTVSASKQAIARQFGSGATALWTSGLLEIIESAGELPADLASAVRPGDKAIYIDAPPRGPKAVLFADQVTSEDDAARSVLHELGVHFGLRRMLGDRRYEELLQRTQDAIRTDPSLAEAERFVLRHYQRVPPGSDLYWEEIIARAVDQSQERSPWRAALRRGCDRFLHLINLRPSRPLDVSELSAIVRGSLRSVIRNAAMAARAPINHHNDPVAARGTPQDERPEFLAWSRGFPVVWPELAHGHVGCGVFMAYHGTTHPDIAIVDMEHSALSSDSFLGPGFYCTSSRSDASKNYAGFGPDLTSRIDNLADTIDQDKRFPELAERWLATDAGVEALGLAGEETALDFSGMDWGEIQDALWASDKCTAAFETSARAGAAALAIAGPTMGLVMPVYVRLEKPFDLRPSSDTFLELEYPDSEPDESGDYPEDEPEDKTLGPAHDFVLAVTAVLTDKGVRQSSITKVVGPLVDAMYGGGFGGNEALDLLERGAGEYIDEGLTAGGLLAEAVKSMGYDGVIMDAYAAFGRRMDLHPETAHIVAFTPNQIKSALGNSGAFSLHDNDITRRASEQIETPAFNAWFQNSKVSQDGRPMVVYHGASRPPGAFPPTGAARGTTAFGSNEVQRHGIFVTADSAVAAFFANQGGSVAVAGIMPLYAAINNPVDMRNGFSVAMHERICAWADARGSDGVRVANFYCSRWGDWGLFDEADGCEPGEMVEMLQDLGYDGVILPPDDGGDGSGPTFVALSPNQLRSAIGRCGDFDAAPQMIAARRPTQGLT